MKKSEKKARITDKKERKGFAERLFNLRTDSKNKKTQAITQEEIANRLSILMYGEKGFISGKRISDWENGDMEPKLDMVVGLAKVFNTTCDFLLTGVDPEHVDASRRYGLSNDALMALEKMNSNKHFHLDRFTSEMLFSDVAPIEFINALLVCQRTEEVAEKVIGLIIDIKDIESKKQIRKAKNSEDIQPNGLHMNIEWKDINESNKMYFNDKDFLTSQEYHINKLWNQIMDEVMSNPFLFENGVKRGAFGLLSVHDSTHQIVEGEFYDPEKK